MNRKRIEKKPRKNLCGAVIAFAVALAFILPTSTVFANDVNLDITNVRFEPPAQEVEKGEIFTASVYIEPVDWVIGLNFVTITFDPTYLQADGVVKGDFFGGKELVFDGGDIDNVAGTISDGYSLVDVGDAVIDPGSIFVITFTAKDNPGTSSLVMSGIKVPGKTPGQYLDFDLYDGSVTVEGEVSSVEWDVTLNFNEDGGKHDYVVFGEALDANDGQPHDSYDVVKPPEPPLPYLRAWFNDDLFEPYNLLWEDYRQYPDTEKVWNLSVLWMPDDYVSSTDITISWDINDLDGSEYNGVALYDVSGGVNVAYMLTDTSYTFTAEAMDKKDFQIICVTSQQPYMPNNPNPNNDATGVDINADLSWTGGDPDPDDTVSYVVYFGTTSPPPKFIGIQPSTTCDPGKLDYDTTYYWKIVAWDNHGTPRSGPIWSFTTKGDPGGGEDPGGDPGGANVPPIADANGPYTGVVGIPVTFNGSGSNDTDGDITNYTWHFGDRTEGYGKIIDHIYAEASNYTVTLLVTDDGGKKCSNLTYAIITGVANNPPSIPVVTGSRMGQKNIIYNYNAVSTDLDNDTIRYFFDWGDGTNTASDFLESGTIYDASHNWTTSGVYTITVYAEDENHGVSGTTEMVVFIDVNKLFIDDVIQGYLFDTDNDGIYDIFHNNATGNETDLGQDDDGNYLIDVDGDGDWDYTFDLIAGLSTYQKEEEQKRTPGFELIIVVCTIAVFLFWKRKRRDVY